MLIDFIRKSSPKNIHMLEILLLLVSSISAVALILLALELYDPYWSLFIGIIISLIILKLFHFKIVFRDSRFSIVILLIIFIALFLRFKPYIYLSGGQDQGLYISMATQFEEQRGIYTIDTVRENLDDKQKQIYDEGMLTEGSLVPGVAFIDAESSKFLMPFYPLHSVWLNVFKSILGAENSVYSLTFFSLLSIFAFYLLGYEISNKKRFVGYLSALLLSVNPLHVFFSKFPVTEITALAFTAFGFYYLIKYYKFLKGEGKFNLLYFLLSLAMFNCFFYTRTSGLIYLPFFYLLAWTTLLFERKRFTRKSIFTYLLFLLALLIISAIYYYKYLTLLFMSYYLGISSRLGTPKLLIFGTIIFALCFFLMVANELRKRLDGEKLLQITKKLISIWTILSMVLIVIFNLYNTYKLGFTDTYVGIPFDTWWQMTNTEWRAFKYTALYNTILYISPFGFLLYVYQLFRIKQKSLTQILLFIFISYFFLFTSYLMPFVSYHFYYARYLLTEIVPFMLLATAQIMGSRFKNKILRMLMYFLVAFSILYSLFFSLPQLKGEEGAHIQFYKDFDEYVNTTDLVLISINEDYSWPSNELMTPLKFYFNFPTMRLKKTDYIYKTELINMYEDYSDVYLLVSQRIDSYRGVEYVKSLQYEQSFFSRCNEKHLYTFLVAGKSSQETKYPFCNDLIPTSHNTGSIELYLYRVDL